MRARLAGRVSVLIGHSGVGKSTLVNALVPGADCARSASSTTSPAAGGTPRRPRVALRLPGGGWVVDTPGIRSFGLGARRPGPDHQRTSPTSRRAPTECPRGCTHDEPECGLDALVAAGGAGPAGAARLESLRRLLRSRAGSPEDPKDETQHL